MPQLFPLCRLRFNLGGIRSNIVCHDLVVIVRVPPQARDSLASKRWIDEVLTPTET
jgi:hypothetical protein